MSLVDTSGMIGAMPGMLLFYILKRLKFLTSARVPRYHHQDFGTPHTYVDDSIGASVGNALRVTVVLAKI